MVHVPLIDSVLYETEQRGPPHRSSYRAKGTIAVAGESSVKLTANVLYDSGKISAAHQRPSDFRGQQPLLPHHDSTSIPAVMPENAMPLNEQDENKPPVYHECDGPPKRGVRRAGVIRLSRRPREDICNELDGGEDMGALYAQLGGEDHAIVSVSAVYILAAFVFPIHSRMQNHVPNF